jgi:aryl-alcohol dehydrogenase-like predicted oxidoreductase
MAEKIVLGTAQFGLDYGINNSRGKPTPDVITGMFHKAYTSGIRTLDTADAYGNAQEMIGSFHQNHTIRFNVNTKFRNEPGKELRPAVARTIEQLHVGSVHTLFYHSFKDYSSYPGLRDELHKLRSEQMIGQIGVSIYTNSELETVCNDPVIDVIQLPFNLLDNINQRGRLLKKLKANKKIIQVRSLFLQGLFFKDISTLPTVLLPLKPYLEKLRNICSETGLSMEALCLQYANAQPDIDEIVIGVDNEQQLLNNIHFFHVPLDPDIQRVIDEIQVTETSLLYPFNWT